MRSQITPDRRANAIQLKFSSNKMKKVVLVEGNSDVIFYGKFVIQGEAQLESCDGNQNVIEVTNILKQRGFQDYIAIIDLDFREIDNDRIVDLGVFHTDFHDIEISILESRALDDVLRKYQKDDKFDDFESKHGMTFLEKLYSISTNVGYLKYANKTDELGLVFKPERPEGNQPKFEKFIDVDNLEYTTDEKMCDYFIQYSKNRQTTVSSRSDILASLKKHKQSAHDHRQLCNGHDLCKVISLALKKVVGPINVSSVTIEENLIFAYDSSAFKQSNLYQELQNWEKSNHKLFD